MQDRRGRGRAAVTEKKEPNSVGVLLRIPVFRRLWAAIAISSFGDWLGLLATTTLAAFLTRDSSGLAQGAAVSGVLLTRLLPDLLLAPVAGALVDRIDRRVLAVAGDTLAGLLYLSIAVSGNLTWLLVAQFLVEGVGLFSNPAKQAMWVNIVPRERLAVANQLNYVSIYGMVPIAAGVFALLSTVAQFFGAPVAAAAEGSSLISGPTSPVAINIALVIDAITYFGCAGTVFISRGMIPAFVGERSTGRSVFSLIAEGVSFVKNSRVMRALYLGILGAFGAGGLTAGVAQAYVSALGAGSAGYGILFGSVFTGLAVGMLTGPKILPTVPRRMIFTSAVGMAGLVLVVMSTLPDFVGAVIASTVMGWAAGIAWITGNTMIGHEVSDQLRGRVFAFVMSSVRLTLLATIAVGPVLAGVLRPLQVDIGRFSYEMASPAIVLALGGILAMLFAGYSGRQMGGLLGALARRLLRRRRAGLLGRSTEHPGALIAVEGARPEAVAIAAKALAGWLGEQGWQVRVAVAPGLLAVPVGHSPPEHLPAEHLPADHVSADRPQSDRSDPDPSGSGNGQTGEPTAADALRTVAGLAEMVATVVRPELQAGSVVVCSGYLDAVVTRFGAVAGLGDEQLLRTAAWAVDGLWPDLTVMLDEPVPGPADPTDHSEAGSTGAEPADADPTGGSLPAGDAPSEPDGTSLVALAQAYRDRAWSAPERYLIVPAVSACTGDGTLAGPLAEQVSAMLRRHSPVRVHPGPSRTGSAPVPGAPLPVGPGLGLAEEGSVEGRLDAEPASDFASAEAGNGVVGTDTGRDQPDTAAMPALPVLGGQR